MSASIHSKILAGMAWAALAAATAAAGEVRVAPSSRCEGSASAGMAMPTAADPYPLMAAGWGPEAGKGLMASRWAEDWSGMRAAGRAPAFKAMPLAGQASLSLSAELRLRHDQFDNPLQNTGRDFARSLLRGVVGADLRFDETLRLFGEVATGQVGGGPRAVGANFRNEASLQQLFVDVHSDAGPLLVGAMVGRQEFADGPRQLLSLGDGSNLHRSWNGIRGYVHGPRLRVGAFDLRATALERGAFDDGVRSDERLQGINASFILGAGAGPNTYFEPFWYRTGKLDLRIGDSVGADDRDTFGARVWGRLGRLRHDWTLAVQRGRFDGRRVHAWGLFAVQSFELTENGWKPQVTAHVDIASAGRADAAAANGFNPLYASSGYLGEGQFLALSNLLMVAPGFAVKPGPTTSLTLEAGIARRLDESAPVLAGGLRAYPGTGEVGGHAIGSLLRAGATWSPAAHTTLSLNFEQLHAGAVLRSAGLASARYIAVGATWRY